MVLKHIYKRGMFLFVVVVVVFLFARDKLGNTPKHKSGAASSENTPAHIKFMVIISVVH